MITDFSSLKSAKLISLINQVAPNGMDKLAELFGPLSKFSDVIMLKLDDFCEFLEFAYHHKSLDAQVFDPVWKLILIQHNDDRAALANFLVTIQADHGRSQAFKTFLKNIIVTKLISDNKIFRVFIPDTAMLLLYCIILLPEYSQKITSKFCEPAMLEWYFVFPGRLRSETFVVKPPLSQPLQVAPFINQIDAFFVANPPQMKKLKPSDILAIIPDSPPEDLLQVITNRLKREIPEKHRKQLLAIHFCFNDLYQTDSAIGVSKSRILDLLNKFVDLIALPYKVDQGDFSLCLPATVLMQLLDTNPLLCAQLLKDLIINGNSTTHLQLRCDSSTINGAWSVDQIFMMALRNGSNSYFNYRPYTNWLNFYEYLTGVGHLSEGLRWLEESGFKEITYSNISGYTSNNTNYHAITFERSLATLKCIKTNLEDGKIVSLMINIRLLTNIYPQANKKSLFFDWPGGHSVVLKNLEINESENTVSLTMWSNARKWHTTLPINQFLNNYHGFETAKLPESNLIATPNCRTEMLRGR